MTNHFHAVDPAGGIHTRSSASRIYTHTVVVWNGGLEGYESARKRASDSAEATVRSNWSYDVECAEQGERHRHYHVGGYAVSRNDTRTHEQRRADDLAELRAKVAKGIDTVIAEKRLAAEKRIDAQQAEGYFQRWINAGWCGRLDLAQKLASQQKGKTEILAAIPGKAPKDASRA